jgi:hypothetical protein
MMYRAEWGSGGRNYASGTTANVDVIIPLKRGG